MGSGSATAVGSPPTGGLAGVMGRLGSLLTRGAGAGQSASQRRSSGGQSESTEEGGGAAAATAGGADGRQLPQLRAAVSEPPSTMVEVLEAARVSFFQQGAGSAVGGARSC